MMLCSVVLSGTDWGGRLSPEAVARAFKTVARYLKLPAQDVEEIRGHSVRVGATQDLFACLRQEVATDLSPGGGPERESRLWAADAGCGSFAKGDRNECRREAGNALHVVSGSARTARPVGWPRVSSRRVA